MLSEKALFASCLDVRFPNSTDFAVRGASLEAKAGEIHAIVGQSGAGKSSLLNALAGFLPIESGHIRIGDVCLAEGGVHHIPPSARRLSFVFQDPSLFPHMTIAENILFGVKGASKAHRQGLVTEWLEKMQLPGRRHDYPNTLSRGEAQRIAVARALAANPSAILLDEPFSGLNAGLKAQMQALVFAHIRHAGLPCIWVTHAAKDAMTHADHISVMSKGCIHQTGGPVDLYQNPNTAEVLCAISDAFMIKATDWPEGLLGFTPLPSHKSVWVRPSNFRLDPNGRKFALIQKQINGERIQVDLVRGDTRLGLLLPMQDWDALILGEDVKISANDYAVFSFA